MTRERILVLGGGFAGVEAAASLERTLGRDPDVEIALVNKDNYTVFQPMLPEVISGSIGILDTVSPLRRLLPRTTVHVREVESIDLERRVVTTTPGVHPHPHSIAYDHLVLALGTVTDFRGLRGLPEHALPFKNLADAIHLRNHGIRALEEAAIEVDPEIRQQLLTFVVAGGGFSGVEVVAELNDFVRRVARSYRGIDPSEIRVVLLHSQDRILPEMTEKLARFAERILARRGVELRLGTRLEAATGEEALLTGGERIPTRTLVSTVPSSPHPLIESLDLPKGRGGRLEVDAMLRVRGAEGLWALGDCALVAEPSGEGFCPPTAQHAIRQARTAAHNVFVALRGGRPKVFDFRGLGKMGSLGHRSAVAEVFGLQISGFLAWWMWRTIYLAKLPGWGRRLKVATAWTLDLLLPPELVGLGLTSSAGLTQEHFEPGQVVFHQGDLGDRMYIVTSGAAEVVLDDRGSERTLARLGAGQVFGEMALLSRTTRNATVRCVEPMNTLSIPKRDVGLLGAYLPGVRSSLETVAGQRALELDEIARAS